MIDRHHDERLSDLKSAHWPRARDAQRVADFVASLERLRRHGQQLAPDELAELWGNPDGSERAHELGYSDVVDSRWDA